MKCLLGFLHGLLGDENCAFYSSRTDGGGHHRDHDVLGFVSVGDDNLFPNRAISRRSNFEQVLPNRQRSEMGAAALVRFCKQFVFDAATEKCYGRTFKKCRTSDVLDLQSQLAGAFVVLSGAAAGG